MFNQNQCTMITINLKRCKKQLDVLMWAFDAMDALPKEEQVELWGREIQTTYVNNDNIISIEEDVIDDLKFRLEDQYLQMAEEVGWDEVNDKPFNYANEERAVYQILDKLN